MAFDVHDTIPRRRVYDWQRRYEAFSVCRNCNLSTVFLIAQNAKADDRFVAQHDPPAAIHGSLNPYFEIEGFICVKDIGAIAPQSLGPSRWLAQFLHMTRLLIFFGFSLLFRG
jgi:hypothetical protein